MIRLFAAIAVPEALTERLTAMQAGVRGARWRPAEALHITLRFFGDIDEAAAADVDEALGEITGAPFALSIAGVGHFGEGRRLRALWAGLDESEPLRRLAARCESAARKAGLKPDARLYTPHVTLAYLNDASPYDVGGWLQAHNLQRQPPFEAACFGLYSSWQGRSVSSYTLERSYPLNGPESATG